MPILDVRLETFDPEVHSPRLRDWLRQPHVGRWWGDPQLAFDAALRHSSETRALIAADGAPVGFLCWQTPAQNELATAGLADLPKDLVDIDLLIGEPEVIGHGVGPRALGLLLTRLREDPFVSVAGVGTSVLNESAIRAFEKVGFRLFREFQDPEYGSCWYMLVEVRDVV